MQTDQKSTVVGEEAIADSKSLGALVLPALRRLLQSHDSIRAIILTTAEGFNVCALGVGAAQVSKMASLVSSMNAMSDAVVATASLDDRQRVSLVTIESADNTILVITRVGSSKTPLLLMILAQRAVLGAIHVLARATAQELAALL